jgi:cytoskeletal protein CcmA (bactofilin family)
MFKNNNKTKQMQDVETVIGPSVKVEGDFEGTGDMIVDGIVVGNLKTKNFLQVGKEAKIKANIEAQNAYISGEVVGN